MRSGRDGDALAGRLPLPGLLRRLQERARRVFLIMLCSDYRKSTDALDYDSLREMVKKSGLPLRAAWKRTGCTAVGR